MVLKTQRLKVDYYRGTTFMPELAPFVDIVDGVTQPANLKEPFYSYMAQVRLDPLDDQVYAQLDDVDFDLGKSDVGQDEFDELLPVASAETMAGLLAGVDTYYMDVFQYVDTDPEERYLMAVIEIRVADNITQKPFS